MVVVRIGSSLASDVRVLLNQGVQILIEIHAEAITPHDVLSLIDLCQYRA